MSAEPSLSTSSASGRERAFLLLCPATVFLSAFLLFLIEPMVAKMILPWFGGSAAVWAMCLVFFQSALLLGYYYADRTSRWLSSKRQAGTHIVLLALSFGFLPLLPSARRSTHLGADPSWRVLGLLTATIGLPFVLLSATSPLMQIWFRRLRPQADAYYLFSLSNFASFLALLAYPFLIEPRMPTSAQAGAWSALFALFVPLCATTAFLSRTGVNDHLTQNVAPVPLLWVLPLAFYLLTFMLVFSRKRFYHRWFFARLSAVFLLAMGYEIYDSRGIGAVQISVPLF